ncbi:LacI family DNA-binding transcriptional regulator [Aureimonas sp. SK2]|uniref:LacI family DNA-binding transcriptional regulator n=1 Tax=Aureimonas sp. SK2 TaxID=3015992 RepID=UPI0024453134|nr:substrate-binding domain-containing protein [Aureimonas sp. SK2]
MVRNLKDLADHLNLSPATVSRALNGFPEVSAKTRRRVMEAAEALNFRPNPLAQRLATGRADAIGILFGVADNMLDNPIVTDLLTGISETAAERGLAIHLFPTRAGEERAACRRIVASGAVDALVFLSPILDRPATADLAEIDFPVVCHGRPRFGQAVASLSVDNLRAFEAGTAHLARLGHRRIALLNGEEAYAYALDRRQGYRLALSKAGLDPDPALEAAGPQTFAHGYGSARRLLALASPPTAFLCTSVLVATGAARALADLGLRIPGDVSLMAHDDVIAALPAEIAAPGLTVLRSSVRLAGRRIAEMAILRRKGTPAADLVEVWDVPLVEGASTGPAPGTRTFASGAEIEGDR